MSSRSPLQGLETAMARVQADKDNQLRTLSAEVDRLRRDRDRWKQASEKKHWRCFHCDEVFTSEVQARLHFGEHEFQDAACVTKDEKGLLEAWRQAEAEAEKAYADLHAENGEALDAMRALRSRITHSVTEAEQRGYDRGLRDHVTTIMGLVASVPEKRIVVPPGVLENLPRYKLERSFDQKTQGELYEIKEDTSDA